jgi:hypothetical protein
MDAAVKVAETKTTFRRAKKECLYTYFSRANNAGRRIIKKKDDRSHQSYWETL